MAQDETARTNRRKPSEGAQQSETAQWKGDTGKTMVARVKQSRAILASCHTAISMCLTLPNEWRTGSIV